ncbi:MAG TPA: choice-of-anchor D domain-containing protein [Streptosporangiaceae bacterium]|nr:choice-of-anchor D domain-containing protein [Streptosporangiaceae bacterium]
MAGRRYENEPRSERQQWNAWHLTRPLLGTAFGTFAALIVVLILGTVGQDGGGEPDLTPSGAATLMVIAFVVGYRQHVFMRLVERVTDIILGPGKKASEAEDVPFEVTPSSLDFGEVAAGSSTNLEFTIANRGEARLQISPVEMANGAVFAPVGEAADVEPNRARTVAIRFTPATAGIFKDTAKITAGGQSKTVRLTGIGVGVGIGAAAQPALPPAGQPSE